jgi:hypothetical protein
MGARIVVDLRARDDRIGFVEVVAAGVQVALVIRELLLVTCTRRRWPGAS